LDATETASSAGTLVSSAPVAGLEIARVLMKKFLGKK
jgi:hypothetical protein